MNIRCLLGIHSWVDQICRRCHKVRGVNEAADIDSVADPHLLDAAIRQTIVKIVDSDQTDSIGMVLDDIRRSTPQFVLLVGPEVGWVLGDGKARDRLRSELKQTHELFLEAPDCGPLTRYLAAHGLHLAIRHEPDRPRFIAGHFWAPSQHPTPIWDQLPSIFSRVPAESISHVYYLGIGRPKDVVGAFWLANASNGRGLFTQVVNPRLSPDLTDEFRVELLRAAGKETLLEDASQAVWKANRFQDVVYKTSPLRHTLGVDKPNQVAVERALACIQQGDLASALVCLDGACEGNDAVSANAICMVALGRADATSLHQLKDRGAKLFQYANAIVKLLAD